MANDYTSSTDAFQDMSEGNYSSSDYPQMADFVTSASRLVDAELGRWEGFFYPSTDTQVRYYNGDDLYELDIDEFVSISELAVSEHGGLGSSDYTVWSSSDYILEPYNYTANAKPIKRIVIDSINGSQSGFSGYRKSVRVTGIPGYSATPPALIAAIVRRQAVRWFMQAKQGYQDTGVTAEIGGLTFSKQQLDPDIKKMLHPYILELS